MEQAKTTLEKRANAVVARSVSAQCVGGGGVAWYLQCEAGVAGELSCQSVGVRVVLLLPAKVSCGLLESLQDSHF